MLAATRIHTAQWEIETYGEGERVFLKSIGLGFEIADMYRGVDVTI